MESEPMTDESSNILDKYYLGCKIGQGSFAKVLIGQEKSSGGYVALKIMKKEARQYSSEENEYFGQIIQKIYEIEVGILKQMDHPNIIHLIEFGDGRYWSKGAGKNVNVCVLVLELAEHGELFEYVKGKERFDEEIVRFYFTQLIEALEYIHGKGFAHRDIKLDNLLLDSNYNLKVSDFGLSAILPKNMQYYVAESIGGDTYRAPEINYKKPYKGEPADIFAAGVNLFNLMTLRRPFHRADKKDKYYSALMEKNYERFWTTHNLSEPVDSKFRDLIQRMLEFHASKRIKIVDIKKHAWYNQPQASNMRIIEEFSNRFEKLSERNVKISKQKSLKTNPTLCTEPDEKASPREDPNFALINDGKIFKVPPKNIPQEEHVEGPENELDLRPYDIKYIHRGAQQIVTSEDGKAIFKYICEYLAKNKYNPKKDATYCKVKFDFMKKKLNESLQESFSSQGSAVPQIALSEGRIEIFKMEDGKCCIDFARIKGDIFKWGKVISRLEKHIVKPSSKH